LDVIFENLGHVFLMAALLSLSAFFSGAETAFFNLSSRQIKQFHNSSHKLCKLAAIVASRQRELLSSILFGNMTVNVLYFASSSILLFRIEKELGVGIAAIFAVVIFSLLLLCGEVLPKSISYSSSPAVSIFAAVPAYGLMKILKPFVSVLQILIVTPALRLLIGSVKKTKPITIDEFRSLARQVKRSGLITAAQSRLLGEIAELHMLKVRHCLCPRVDMTACQVNSSVKKIIQTMKEKHLTKVPVYHKKIDNITGLVHLRDLLLKPGATVNQLVRNVNFVPEQKTIESLLEYFRQTHSDMAIAVDEYGGIAGTISLEDIAEEIFGPIADDENSRMIENIGPLEYRLSGALPVHEWMESFGMSFPEARFSTVGGLVTALLGRIPKEGDKTRLRNLLFTIERVKEHRVMTVILKLEPLTENAG